MVKERYTGFQLHRVNDSDGLNSDDIDYAFAILVHIRYDVLVDVSVFLDGKRL
jgi:hypothetical protein